LYQFYFGLGFLLERGCGPVQAEALVLFIQLIDI